MDCTTLQIAERLKTLKARYCRLLDTKRWTDWGELFSVDATLDASEDFSAEEGVNPVMMGRNQIVSQISAFIVGGQSVHHVYHPELQILSDVEASGIWAMDDMILFDSGTPFGIKRGWGHYHETYRFENGAWQIASLRLTRLRINVE